ncbi:hypothetical protein LXJ59_27315, partial [Escherichia coli]|nr:hypothetical protein [Escherichia coli]
GSRRIDKFFGFLFCAEFFPSIRQGFIVVIRDSFLPDGPNGWINQMGWNMRYLSEWGDDG